jgi:hypothetical protein
VKRGQSKPAPTLGRGDILILESSQFFTQSRRFSAILCRLDMKLDCIDTAHGIENLGESVVFALAGMFELVSEFVLVQGIGL